MRTIAIALLSLAGCIDEYQGSNVQIDLAEPFPIQATVGATPRTGELPNNVHFRLYAFREYVNESGDTVGSLFELQRFETHRVTDLTSPCFIDTGPNVPFSGLHVSRFIPKMQEKTGITDLANPGNASRENQIDMATAQHRYNKVLVLASDVGLKVVTSHSVGGYPAVAANCTDPNGIPPPMCDDAESNKRRDAACAAAWDADPLLFEGTDRVLTKPLNGIANGYVNIAMSPINFAPIGGAQWFLDETLDDFDGYAIYWQFDDANSDGMPDYPGSWTGERTKFGELMMFGRPEMPTRGRLHVHMRSFVNPSWTAELAIFADLAQDDVHF